MSKRVHIQVIETDGGWPTGREWNFPDVPEEHGRRIAANLVRLLNLAGIETTAWLIRPSGCEEEL